MMLISKARERDIRAGKPENIIPELCHGNGLTIGLRLMQQISNFTRLNPSDRVKALIKFNKRPFKSWINGVCACNLVIFKNIHIWVVFQIFLHFQISSLSPLVNWNLKKLFSARVSSKLQMPRVEWSCLASTSRARHSLDLFVLKMMKMKLWTSLLLANVLNETIPSTIQWAELLNINTHTSKKLTPLQKSSQKSSTFGLLTNRADRYAAVKSRAIGHPKSSHR